MRKRSAITLLELLVVLAIIGVLLALLVPAIMRVREAAAQTQSENNLRQIAIATTSYADANAGQLPSLQGVRSNIGRVSLFVSLLPYIEHGNYYAGVQAGTISLSSDFVVATYLSPADPSLFPIPAGLASYGANGQVFRRPTTIVKTYLDGASNTISFAEHYSYCNKTHFNWFLWFPEPDVDPDGSVVRRASFADFAPKNFDVFPVTSGNPPTSTGSVPGLTFQARPTAKDCDPRIAQTPHAGGMLAAFGDSSVRSLSPAISNGTYWALVTPAGGEALGSDW